MGWKTGKDKTKPHLDRLRSIVEKLKELKKLSADMDESKLKNLMVAMESTIKVRERNNNDDMDKKTPSATISSRISEHRRLTRKPRYKRRSSSRTS